MDALQAELAALEAEALPSKFTSTENIVDSRIIEDYHRARDAYLQSKVAHTLLARLANGAEAPAVPDDEERQALQERRNQVIAEVQSTAEQMQQKLREHETLRAAFLSRKQELEQMLLESQASSRVDDGDEEMEDVDDADLAAEDARLQALQQRKIELEHRLASVEHENMRMQKSIQQSKASLDGPITQEALKELQTKNAALSEEVAKYAEIKEFYEGLRLVMEELRGLKVISVDRALESSNLVLKVQLLNQFDMDIELQVQPDSSHDNVKVAAAKLTSSPTIRGPSVPGTTLVELTVPALDDLVKLSDSTLPDDGLRFVLRETLARIQVLEARAKELTLLQQEGTVEMGPYLASNFGGEDQDVMIAFDGNTVLLRLTPDCPMVPGSVYVDQVSKNGQLLEELHMAGQAFRSPVALVQAIKGKMQGK